MTVPRRVYPVPSRVEHLWSLVDQCYELVTLCFRPSQPQRITSELRKTFTERYIVERTNKAEKDQKNRGRKRRVVGRIYGMEYSWKCRKDRSWHKNIIKRSGQTQLVYVKDINRNIPTTWRWTRGNTMLWSGEHYLSCDVVKSCLLWNEVRENCEGAVEG